MLVTITQYFDLGRDSNGLSLPLAVPRSSQARSSNGSFTAFEQEANFIRIASDTDIQIADGKGNIMYFPANAPEYVGVMGGEVYTVTEVV